MRVLAAVLAAGLMVGGNDGRIDVANDTAFVLSSVPRLQLELRSGHSQPDLLRTDPLEGNRALNGGNARDGQALYSIRIHGLATDGIVSPAPTPTPMPLPTPANRSVTDIICALSWPCDQALAVARCESNLNPNAWNRIQVWMTVPGYGYVANYATGLFQMLIPLHSWRFAGADPYDAEANVRAAYSLYLERGWQPWHASAHCSGVW